MLWIRRSDLDPFAHCKMWFFIFFATTLFAIPLIRRRTENFALKTFTNFHIKYIFLTQLTCFETNFSFIIPSTKRGNAKDRKKERKKNRLWERLLCILTHFQVLWPPQKWSKYFFGCFQEYNFLRLFLSLFIFLRLKRRKRCKKYICIAWSINVRLPYLYVS